MAENIIFRWPDRCGVRNHDVDADTVKMGKTGLDIVPHAVRRLPGKAEQQAAVVEVGGNLLGVGLVNALVEYPLAVVRVEGFHADFDMQRDPLLCKPRTQRR